MNSFHKYLRQGKNALPALIWGGIVALAKGALGLVFTLVKLSAVFAFVLAILAIFLVAGYFIIGEGDKIIACFTDGGGAGKYAQCLALNKTDNIHFDNLFKGAATVTTIILTAIGLYFIAARLKDQKEQTASQIRKEIDERFSNAIALLGNDKASARTGAVYALYQLAIDDKKYRKQVAEILCGYIRSQTREDSYPIKHRDKPSADIQATIDVLFKNDDEKKGLYARFSLPLANLSSAYLAGADFIDANCQDASFAGTNCRGACFWEANIRQVNFLGADCRDVNFVRAECQRAKFWKAYCQGAQFQEASCQGTSFREAECQGTSFMEAKCQGANFLKAICHKTDFVKAGCEGACFDDTQCQGAIFYDTQCHGAYAIADKGYIPLFRRIGKHTQLETMVTYGLIEDNSAVYAAGGEVPGIKYGKLKFTLKIFLLSIYLRKLKEFPIS